jgi:DNA-binding PadR family transcriptional regulator
VAPSDDLDSYLPLGHLDFEILVSLARGELHGYAIAADIGDRTGGVMNPGMSSLYLAVRRLVKSGFVTDAGHRGDESDGPPRRYYRITRRGRAVAQRETQRLQAQARAASRVFRDV